MISTRIFRQRLNTSSIWNQAYIGQWVPLKAYVLVSTFKFCENYWELSVLGSNEIENCRVKRALGGFCFSVLSFLLPYETELILTKIITFRKCLSIHKGSISLKMLNNYEYREMRNTFLLWDCRKNSEILKLNIMMNIDESTLKVMN